MNNAPSSSIASGCKFPNMMVDQTPRFDRRTVTSRKAGIRRPDKRRKKTKFL